MAEVGGVRLAAKGGGDLSVNAGRGRQRERGANQSTAREPVDRKAKGAHVPRRERNDEGRRQANQTEDPEPDPMLEAKRRKTRGEVVPALSHEDAEEKSIDAEMRRRYVREDVHPLMGDGEPAREANRSDHRNGVGQIAVWAVWVGLALGEAK